MRDKHSRGLTLVGLVVLIIIIGILAAILIPALTPANGGRIPRCMVHLKQIGIALQMYANTTGFLPCNPYRVGEAERQNSSTVEIWRGYDKSAIGLGLLAVGGRYLRPELLFCRRDKYHAEYASNFGKPETTLRSSYIYRCYCEGMGPKLDHEGTNSAGKEAVALVMDFNCLDIGEGEQAENHKGKAIHMLFKDLHVEKVTNPHGMELYKQKTANEWVLAPFLLVLEKDDPANHRALWIAADECKCD